MNSKIIMFVGVIAIILFFVQPGDSVCCSGKSLATCRPDGSMATLHTRLCGDCTLGTPYCAYGKCNIFGCNCDHGCREGRCSGSGCRRRRSIWENSEHDKETSSYKNVTFVISNIDGDSDGKLTLAEVTKWINKEEHSEDNYNLSEIFSEMDQDQDGYLTILEIDDEKDDQN